MSPLFALLWPMFRQLASRTSVLTATVRGPTEEFQKKLRSNPYSASDLDFPAEKVPLRNKTAMPPTHNGQNGCFCPTRGVFQQYVGGIAVLLRSCTFSAGSSKSDAERGFGLSFFWNSSVGPCTVAVNTEVQCPAVKISGFVRRKSELFFWRPPKILL